MLEVYALGLFEFGSVTLLHAVGFHHLLLLHTLQIPPLLKLHFLLPLVKQVHEPNVSVEVKLIGEGFDELVQLLQIIINVLPALMADLIDYIPGVLVTLAALFLIQTIPGLIQEVSLEDIGVG